MMWTSPMFPALLALLIACQGAPPAVVDAPKPTPPAPTPPPTASPAPTDEADALLSRMEAQGKSMKDFTASATVEKFEALTEEKEIRRGRIVVEGAVGPTRKVAIIVDEFIDATGRGSTDGRRYLFAGGWFDEFDALRKQCIRRQVARAGESVDPLRVGEGPFPVPLGQPKADVLREFTVTAGTLPSAPFFKSLLPRAEGLVALRLVPRAGTAMARDTAALTVVVDSVTLAPEAIEVEQVNGDATRALFRHGKLDAGLDAAARDLLTPPAMDGWKIDTRPLA